jgi:hypothetical protein
MPHASKRSFQVAKPAILVVGAAFLMIICVAGCGSEEQSEPPTSGDELRAHLLGIIKARHEAALAGDLAKARSYNLPYANAEDKVFWELTGRQWDRKPTQEEIESFRESPTPTYFSGDTPIELEQSGDWARLRQVDGDRASNAYFLLQNDKWWLVSAYFSDANPATDDKFAYLRADTYWPDHIADYFLLPEVEIEIAPSATPSEHTYYNKELSLHVTNVSDTTISTTAMGRGFRSVKFVVGTSQSAVEPFGGEEFRDLEPGERFFVGNVQIRVPEDEKSFIVFYVGPYVSNRLPTK